MKITKSKLNQIIKEEIEQLARGHISLSRGQTQKIRQTQNNAKKIIRLLISDDPGNVDLGLTALDALEDQQLTDIIASHFVFRSDGRITIRGFKIPEATFGMLLNHFAEKSVHFKNMLAQIESLDITNDFITNVDFLRFCTNLTRLNLSDCYSLKNLDGLAGCTNLMTLDLWGCKSLQNVNGLEGLTSLTGLNLSYCSSLENIDGLEGCTNLDYLYLIECKSLQNVDGLKECTNLWSLDLSRCELLPPELQKYFVTNSSGTAYEQFMKALNASKRYRP